MNGRAQYGFTLIEVLIAILVLGFGLLGFALLQTMNIRFVQSANQRTQATNLGYELLDQIRANRVDVASYNGTHKAVLNAGSCGYNVGTGLKASKYLANWQCRLGTALGDSAEAVVAQSNDEVSVEIRWGDERWIGAGSTKFSMKTRL